MNKLFFYFKSIFFLLLYLMLGSILSSIFYLYTNMSYNVNCLILFIWSAIGLFVINFLNGKKTKQKGYLEGLKLGGLVILLFFIISLFTKDFISLSKITYYGVLILISIIASSIGINFKDNSNIK